ncbi:MAG TPA: hydantoinase/oxoprolinase family protein [Gaiellaceae bacterium]|nr:hydantoinase/oxoprolinase family protein [Gaiellaceae bacterium]
MDGARVTVAFDTGGTFTDVVVVSDDLRFAFAKELSTPRAPADAILAGVARGLESLGVGFAAVQAVRGATTMITNALIEAKGVRTALLTTAGFADVLEMRREHRYDNYDLQLELPEPYVPRHLRFGVAERIDHAGNVLEPLDERGVLATAEQLRANDVEAVAVCLLHSYREGGHERRVAEILREAAPDVAVTLSSEIAPEIREYERMSTAVINAYTQPIMAQHVAELTELLRARGFTGELTFMLSSGRTRAGEFVAERPAYALESGPAAGAMAASHVGRRAGRRRIISFDMGGTTAKVCVMPDGVPAIARSFEAARTRRFHVGSGHPVRLPTVDLLEVGAGGGSIARVDELGLIQVGPESAGAEPGPACYGNGGVEPTVTDANLLLGYLDSKSFLGGDMQISVDASRAAIERIAHRVEMDTVTAAWWIHSAVNGNMARALRVHVAERGVDARRFTLVSFGGAAGLHVARVAHEVGIREVICPPRAGVASAFGLLVAPPGIDAVVSRPGLLAAVDVAALAGDLGAALAEGQGVLDRMDVPREAIAPSLAADMRYRGQAMEIEVALPALPPPEPGLAERWLGDVRAAFERRYERLYGRTFSHLEVEVVNWRLAVVDSRESSLWVDDPIEDVPQGSREIYLPELQGFVDVAVQWRNALAPGWESSGPAVIQERESTVIVPPFAAARIDDARNLVLTLA